MSNNANNTTAKLWWLLPALKCWVFTPDLGFPTWFFIPGSLFCHLEYLFSDEATCYLSTMRVSFHPSAAHVISGSHSTMQVALRQGRIDERDDELSRSSIDAQLPPPFMLPKATFTPSIYIEPNLGLPRTRPPLTSFINTILAIRYWSILSFFHLLRYIRIRIST